MNGGFLFLSRHGPKRPRDACFRDCISPVFMDDQMNRQDVMLQISIVSNMLEGVRNDDVMRADLPVIAAKLRLLGKMIPKVFDVPREASDLLADVQRLRQTWGELYWGDEATSDNGTSQSRAGSGHAVGNRRGPWKIEEERRFLADLDDVGWFLFTAFGRVLPDAKVDGRWQVRIEELVYDAESLRRPAAGDMFERAYAIAMEGVLMRAANGFPRRECVSLAEAIAPAAYELFVTQDPAFVIVSVAERLVIEGLLCEGPGFGREVMFQLTPKGSARSRSALASWQKARIGARGLQAAEQEDDVMPF